MTITEVETALPGPLGEFLADRIPRAASAAHRRFPQVPAEDMEQAMWERALRRGPHLVKLWEAGQKGAIWAELRRAGTRVGMADRRSRYADRAAVAGFSVYDIEFYSTGVLAMILPVLVEAGFDVAEAMAHASATADAAGVHIRSSDPFGGAENYTAILIDVSGAYRRLPEGMRRLLNTYYAVNQEDTEDGRWDRQSLAGSMGLTEEALRQRVHRALCRLQDELGGPDPWR